ncbi:hypothetical protein ABMA28_014791, partial [Loxostege sticticalis]
PDIISLELNVIRVALIQHRLFLIHRMFLESRTSNKSNATDLESIKIRRQVLSSECRCTTADSWAGPTAEATACSRTGAPPPPEDVRPRAPRRGPAARSLAECLQMSSELSAESVARENLYFVVSLVLFVILAGVSVLGYCSGLKDAPYNS